MESTEIKRIKEACKQAKLAPALVTVLAKQYLGDDIVQAVLETISEGSKLKDKYAWIRWRVPRIASERSQKRKNERARQERIDKDRAGRSEESVAAEREALATETAFKAIPKEAVERIVTAVLAQLDPTLREHMAAKGILGSMVLRGMVVHEARKAGIQAKGDAPLPTLRSMLRCQRHERRLSLGWARKTRRRSSCARPEGFPTGTGLATPDPAGVGL